MRRREFSKRVRFEIVQRATGGTGQLSDLRCEGCGLPRPKKWEVDHTIPEALVVDKSKPLTAEDGKLLGYCCHRGEDGKTAADVKIIAKVKRIEARHLGIKSATSRPMAGTRASKFKRKFSGEVVLR